MMQEAKERWGEAAVFTEAEEDGGEVRRKFLAAQADRNQRTVEREPKVRDTKKARDAKKRKAKRKNQRRARRAA